MARAKKPQVLTRFPLAESAERLAGALNVALAYNVRAALGQQFNPRLLDDAQMVLSGALNNYAEALRDEILEGMVKR